MGSWGTKPWDSDDAADWVERMMKETGLAKFVGDTLHREINVDFPGDADEIRAAAAVLLLLGDAYVWPFEDREQHLKLAISRLDEILAKNYIGWANGQIRAEIAVLKSRLEDKTKYTAEKVKWWHFDE